MGRFLKYGWLSAILLIVVIVLLGLALIFIPGLARFTIDVLWNEVSDLCPSYGVLIDVIKGTIDQNFVSPESFGVAFLRMIMAGILDAAVLSICTFFVKTFFFQFEKVTTKNNNRNSKPYSYYDFAFNGPKWLPTLLGILLSLFILKITKEMAGDWNYLLSGLVSIALMLYGIYKILTAGKKNWKKDYRYTRFRDNTGFNLILDVLVSMLQAVIGVVLTGCVLRAPYLVTSFGGFLIWVLWIAGGVALMYGIEFIEKLLKPTEA